jgi:hypothetical protein
VLLHVAEGVLVGVDEDKLVLVEVDDGAHKQVSGLVVLGQLRAVRCLVWLLHAATLQELAADDACTANIEDKIEDI